MRGRKFRNCGQGLTEGIGAPAKSRQTKSPLPPPLPHERSSQPFQQATEPSSSALLVNRQKQRVPNTSGKVSKSSASGHCGELRRQISSADDIQRCLWCVRAQSKKKRNKIGKKGWQMQCVKSSLAKDMYIVLFIWRETFAADME
ncbi:hypothetical protein R1flu_023798 [Riccia fluitans]|uniref:Uncharacterized protein n=1 Tax=Riccia fluitans TaxID=41844 RepID=A0ABD1XW08_9MARC